jgi:hypothetical protein
LIPFTPIPTHGHEPPVGGLCDAERVGGFGSRHFRASEQSTASKRMEHTLLSKDNEICLAWLEDALQQLRPEGQTKAVGYLEAVLEEVVFEMKMAPRL